MLCSGFLLLLSLCSLSWWKDIPKRSRRVCFPLLPSLIIKCFIKSYSLNVCLFSLGLNKQLLPQGGLESSPQSTKHLSSPSLASKSQGKKPKDLLLPSLMSIKNSPVFPQERAIKQNEWQEDISKVRWKTLGGSPLSVSRQQLGRGWNSKLRQSNCWVGKGQEQGASVIFSDWLFLPAASKWYLKWVK